MSRLEQESARAHAPAGWAAAGARGKSMPRYEFHLHITAEQYLDYYRGTVRQVVARSTNGQTVQFPASLLQRFVTKDGIRGHFVLSCDEHHKHAKLERLPASP